MDIAEKIKHCNEMINSSHRMVAFTGAGISADSGIPTYRGDDGVWHKYDPAKYADINHYHQNPAYYWRFFREVRYPSIKGAEPNAAHHRLAALEEQGALTTLITQNIDGLHHLAGSRNVLELHGNTSRIRCLKCGIQYSMDDVYGMLDEMLPPDCPACGGTLKPDVVFFGESLDAGTLEAAVAAIRACELFVVVGSSLVVQPAATLPVTAKENGARVIIINKDPTPLDDLADVVIHAGAADVLAG
ncbi:MAG: NAD-dependent deacylase [Desulfobacteraceae bacterium]|nr:NAD-dependent deacylase [Desulfobacteraceae bacterium]